MLTKYDEINPEKYEERYKKIPREIYLRRHWLPIISDLVCKYCKDKYVLDLGCGYGKYISIIQNCTDKIVGIDISKTWIDYAKNNYPGVDFILGNAETISLKKKFDVIFSIGLLEYVNRAVIIGKMQRALKPEGYCILSVPNKYSLIRLPSRIYHKLFSKRKWPDEPSKREMLNLFLENDLKIVEFTMDDGLIWLPGFLDKLFGIRVYNFIEKIMRPFGCNPFSNIMLFVVKKAPTT